MKDLIYTLITRTALLATCWLGASTAIGATISSVANGQWDSTSTWSCSCIPNMDDAITISIDDTVTMAANIIHENLLNIRGELATAGYNLTLQSTAATLRGNGSITGTGKVIVGVGIVSIHSTASLDIAPAIQLDSSASVENAGTVKVRAGLDGTHGSAKWTNTGTAVLELLDTSNAFVTAGRLLANSTDSKVLFAGSQQQELGGSNSIYHLELNNGSGLVIQNDTQRVTGRLELTAGALTTNNLVVLASTDTLTANVEFGSGSITGDVLTERYVDGPSGFYQLASSVNGATLDKWGDDVLITGIPGSDFPTFWTSVYTYDESELQASTSYKAPDSITSTLGNTGYMLYINENDMPVTLTLQGTPKTGSQSLPVSYTYGGTPDEDGWNLVANPFPSTIDWDAGTSGWTRSMIDDAVYVYDANASQYATYVNGVGTNGGSRYIASGQAFWVKANALGAVLTVKEGATTPEPDATFRQGNDVRGIRIAMKHNEHSDETVLRFDPAATPQHDPQLEALKLFPDGGQQPTVFIEDAGSQYAIWATTTPTAPEDVPVSFYAPEAGSYEFTARLFGDPLNNGCLVLDDPGTGSFIQLQHDSALVVAVTDSGWYHTRLRLRLAPALETWHESPLCAGTSNGSIGLVPDDAWFSTTWSSPELEGNTAELLAAGSYTVSVTNSYGCTRTASFTLVDPPALDLQLTVQDDAYNTCQGSAEANLSGGTAPYSVTLANAAGPLYAADALCAGDYEVLAIDAHGCEAHQHFSIAPGTTTATEEQQQLSWKTKAYPNPGNGKLILEATLPAPESVQLTATDVLGRVIEQTTLLADEGRNQWPVQLTETPGTYLLTLTGSKHSTTERVVVR